MTIIKIHTVFISKPRWEVGWPYLGFDNEEFSKKTMKLLKKRFKDIEFCGGDIITKYENNQMKIIKDKVKKSDGLILYTIGHYGDPGIVNAGVELIQLNIPTILANYIYGGDHTFIKIYDKIKEGKYRCLPISSSKTEELLKAVDILRRILRMKNKKILVYTLDKEVKPKLEDLMNLIESGLEMLETKEREIIINNIVTFLQSTGLYIDLKGIDQAHSWRRDEELYRKNLKDIFGIHINKRNPNEILQYYNKISNEEAERIASKWIKNAKSVRYPRKAIIKSAKLLLALKKIMQEQKTDTIALDCGTLMLSGKLPAWPCLAFFQLWNEGLNGIPESDLDSGVTLLLIRYLFDRAGYISNQSIDIEANQVTYMHCCSPSKLYGDDKPSQKYEIVGHGESHGLGPCPLVEYPKEEYITTIKISILKRKIAIRTGKISGMKIDNKGCVNKVLVNTNTHRILENTDWDTFGWHRVSVLGNWRKEVIAAAKLLGLEIIEEDK